MHAQVKKTSSCSTCTQSGHTTCCTKRLHQQPSPRTRKSTTVARWLAPRAWLVAVGFVMLVRTTAIGPQGEGEGEGEGGRMGDRAADRARTHSHAVPAPMSITNSVSPSMRASMATAQSQSQSQSQSRSVEGLTFLGYGCANYSGAHTQVHACACFSRPGDNTVLCSRHDKILQYTPISDHFRFTSLRSR